jgi:hypothetical protein
MSEAFAFLRPRQLAASDPVATFDCGAEALNCYLQRHALQAQQSEGARTYVSLSEGQIAGYYTLAYGSVEPQNAPAILICRAVGQRSSVRAEGSER